MSIEIKKRDYDMAIRAMTKASAHLEMVRERTRSLDPEARDRICRALDEIAAAERVMNEQPFTM